MIAGSDDDRSRVVDDRSRGGALQKPQRLQPQLSGGRAAGPGGQKALQGPQPDLPL